MLGEGTAIKTLAPPQTPPELIRHPNRHRRRLPHPLQLNLQTRERHHLQTQNPAIIPLTKPQKPAPIQMAANLQIQREIRHKKLDLN